MKLSKITFQGLLTILAYISIAYSQIDSATTFYPLMKGNTWQFMSSSVTRIMGTPVATHSHFYTVTVSGDTSLASGTKYYVVQISELSPVHPRYQRIDSITSQIIAFDTSGVGREYVIDSLHAPAYSSFAGCRIASLKRTLVGNVNSQNYFGTPLMSRHYSTPYGVAEGSPQLIYTLTQGLGLTSIIQAWTGFDQYPGNSVEDALVYAKINGKEYGTPVSVRLNREVISNFVLYQNFSNPSNPATIINYSLPEDYYVSLKVYDILGRVVATLVDEWQNRGFHTATFYGDDLSSGVYFYNLKAGPFNGTRKLILLK
jgi:hypothetical protein